jgi:cell division protease FtsH
VHEAGHAVLALRLGLGVDHVTLQARGAAAGHTRVVPRSFMADRAALEAQVVVILAGRAADELHGAPTAGAFADLHEATRLITAIHASFGLGASLAHRVMPEDAEKLLRFDPKLAAVVEGDLRRLMARAAALVQAHEKVIRDVAAALVARRTLVGEEVAEIMARHRACASLPSRHRDGARQPGLS